MFLSYHYTVKRDDKGRIMIPSEFKEKIQLEYPEISLSVTHGVVPHPCLVIYPEPVWIDKMKKLLNSKKSKHSAQALNMYKRYLTSNCFTKGLDSTGKLLIPQELWDNIAMPQDKGGRDIMLIGNYDSIEVWDPAVWKNFNQKTAEMIKTMQSEEQLAEEFAKIDLESIFNFEEEQEDDCTDKE